MLKVSWFNSDPGHHFLIFKCSEDSHSLGRLSEFYSEYNYVETYKRKPNSFCKVCTKPLYRRPSELQKGNVFCSKVCYGQYQAKPIPCVICGTLILTSKNKKTCSRACSNINRKGIVYHQRGHGVKFSNKSSARLAALKQRFDFEHCMIIGCEYNRTYDIHRHIPGKQGGQYEVGNMFAICPNHHAEVSRGIIRLQKVSDSELSILNGE